MSEYQVTFEGRTTVTVPTGTLLTEAIQQAGITFMQPCGGQGRCGRCAVRIIEGQARQRSTLRLSAEDVQAGYTLACQTVIEGNLTVEVPPQEKIERRLTTDRSVTAVQVPAGYDPVQHQTLQRVTLSIMPPSMDDQTDDWGRFQAALRQEAGIESITASLALLRQIRQILHEGAWQVTALLDTAGAQPRLINICPGHRAHAPLWGAAIDIGTTTVSLWLVDLLTGEVKAQVAAYNGQIARGEDVISRIIYASKGNGAAEVQRLVLDTINTLLAKACQRVSIGPDMVQKITITGNSTMIHLLLNIPADSIRNAPFVTTVNHVPPLSGADLGLSTHPTAVVDCLPGVASYVGADITAGVLSSGLDDADAVTLFIDIGTNGEMVLGNKEWLVTCACSAGPAFEGAGMQDGMRATTGAIEEVWIDATNYEPTYRVIGNKDPSGICGSGLISLIAEMFLTGVIDKGGHINLNLPTPRARIGDHGPEYVIVWADHTAYKRNITITNVDIDNLLRAKAAIYAGFTILADSVGVPLEMAEQVLVGGSFGQYINVEKAIQIGLLPDMPWEQFNFLGNTSIRGAYLALLDRGARDRIAAIADRMTYIELSADNRFYEAFTSALFLPHTDLSLFPTVQAAMTTKE